MAVEVERVVFLALGALGDGDLDVAAVAGVAPDLNVVGLGEPEACGRVGRAVEVRVDLRVELVAVDRRLVEVLAERGVAHIRARRRPVVVGAVVELRAPGIRLLERLAQVDHRDAALAQLLCAEVEHQVVAVRVVNQRQLVAADVARRGREHHRERRIAEVLFEVPDRADVLEEVVVLRNGHVDEVAVAAVIDAVRAVIAQPEGVVAVEADPHIPRRELVGEVGLELRAELARGDGLKGRFGELLQIALFRRAVLSLGVEDEPHRQRRDEHDEHRRRQKPQLSALVVDVRLAFLVERRGGLHRVAFACTRNVPRLLRYGLFLRLDLRQGLRERFQRLFQLDFQLRIQSELLSQAQLRSAL